MVTTKKLDKGGIILRYINKLDVPATYVVLNTDQEDVTFENINFVEPVQPGETIEIKLPYDSLKSNVYVPNNSGIELEIEVFGESGPSSGVWYIYYNPTYSSNITLNNSVIDFSTGGWYYIKIFAE